MRTFNKTEIIKMAAHIFARGRGVPDKRMMHPRREWAIGLLVSALILIVGAALSAQSFGRFRGLDTSGGNSNIELPIYNAALVSNMIETYSTRAERYQMLIGDRSSAVTVTANATSSAATTTTTSTTTTSTTTAGVESVGTATPAELDDESSDRNEVTASSTLLVE